MTSISFGEEDRALGLLLIEGQHDAQTAARLAHFLNMNPGGAVVVQHMPLDLPEEKYQLVRKNRNRLLTEEEAKKLFGGESIKLDFGTLAAAGAVAGK